AGGHPHDPRVPLHGLDDPPHRHHHPDEPAPDDRTPDPPRHDLGIDPEPQRHRTLVNPRPPTENEHVIGNGDIDLTIRHGVAHSAHEGTAHIAWSHPGETIRPLFGHRREFPHRLDQLVGVERLGHVRVHTDLVPPPHIVLLRPRRDHHDPDVRRPGVLPQPDRGDPPVQPRHHHVQRDHVRRDVRHLLQAVLTVHRRRHLEPLELKVHGDELADHLVV